MSLETWKAEFYPIEAEDCACKDAVAHSLRKWIGLRNPNLKKHGLRREHGGDIMPYIVDENDAEFVVDASSCALCVWHRGENEDGGRGCSAACPLRRVLGKTCADDIQSPFQIYDLTQDPWPMIKALRKVKKVKS